MILLDAYALVAFIGGEPAAKFVESILRDDAAITPVNLAEALDVLVRGRQLPADALDAVVVPLLATSLRVVSEGEREARHAASIRAAHYHRTTCPVSMADCFLVSAGAIHSCAVATSDSPLARVARQEGVAVVALPDSHGRRP